MAEFTHGADGEEGGQAIECPAIYLSCEEGQKSWAGTLTASGLQQQLCGGEVIKSMSHTPARDSVSPPTLPVVRKKEEGELIRETKMVDRTMDRSNTADRTDRVPFRLVRAGSRVWTLAFFPSRTREHGVSRFVTVFISNCQARSKSKYLTRYGRHE